MELSKSTILPTDRKADALALFNQLIDDEPLVLFVVLHRDEDSWTLMDRAAKGAGSQGPGWVVWVRRPDQLADRIGSLQGAERLGDDLQKIRAFTLSFSDTVVDVFTMSDPLPDAFDVLIAFTKAIAGTG